jgi:hypothetical protein
MSCFNINNDLKDIVINAYLIYNAFMVLIINLYQALNHQYWNHHSHIHTVFYQDISFAMSISLQYHRKRRKKRKRRSRYQSSLDVHRKTLKYLTKTNQENYYTTDVVHTPSLQEPATKVAKIFPLRGKPTNEENIIPLRGTSTTSTNKKSTQLR